MALYKSLKYAGGLYGSSTPANVRWGLSVDWDENGAYDSDNEAVYLTGLRVSRGRSSYIEERGGKFVPISIGRAELVLRNHDGRYNPYNTSSPLYPNIGPGKFAQIIVRYGADTYTVFTGVIQDLVPIGYNQAVRVVIEDGLRWLADQNISTAVYEQTDAQAVIELLLAQVLWPPQWGQDVGSGADVLEYWWARGWSAFDEMRDVADSELGLFHVAADGKFVYRKRQDDPASVLSLDQSQLLTNPTLPQPWSFRRNIVKVLGHPQRAMPLDVVWQGSEFAISPGESVTITAELSEAAINMITPVATTDYTAYSQSNGAGYNLTGYISVTMTTLAMSAEITLRNSGTRLAYVNFLQVRGNAISAGVVSGTSTGTGYDRHPRSLELDLIWQQDENNPDTFAEQLLTRLNAETPFPVVQIQQRPDVQYAADLFDMVDVDLAAIGISDTFRLGHVEHEWLSENGQSVLTTWSFEPAWAYGYWIFDTASSYQLDVTPLGW